MPAIKARYWLLTIPTSCYTPELKGDLVYLKGQQEIARSGFQHWQILAVFKSQVTQNQCKGHFCQEAHVEPSRSSAANDYVWKEDTRVADSQFELGQLPKSKARKHDWDSIFNSAKAGDLESIPKDVVIRNYSALKRIRVDFMQNVPRPEVNVHVFWGGSGLGKTRRAWHEAGPDAYIKSPNTKWWDGYKGQENVILDEFTGAISYNYFFTWFDRYPCTVECKGYSMPLTAVNFWVTSNLSPDEWYPDLNEHQKQALRRRIKVTHFLTPWSPDPNPNPIIQTEWEDIMNLLSGNDFLNE